jgi:hypothetical protein
MFGLFYPAVVVSPFVDLAQSASVKSTPESSS